MKNTIIITLVNFLLISCSINVHSVQDDFYGTQYYKTDSIYVIGWDSSLEMKFIKINDNIMLELKYNSSYPLVASKGDIVALKFNDNTFSYLDYTSGASKLVSACSQTQNYEYTSTSYTTTYTTYSINAIGKIKKFGNLIAIRLENSDGAKDFKIDENTQKKLLEAYTKIKNI